jgi:hypothetical protein
MSINFREFFSKLKGNYKMEVSNADARICNTTKAFNDTVGKPTAIKEGLSNLHELLKLVPLDTFDNGDPSSGFHVSDKLISKYLGSELGGQVKRMSEDFGGFEDFNFDIA